MVELAQIDKPALLQYIARKRWLIPTRSGRLGRLLRAVPYEARSSRTLIRASTRLSQGRWLAQLAATMGERAGGEPIQVVELGTCVGISGMYLLAGMSQGGGGHLTTFEGYQTLADLASFHFEGMIREHGLDNVSFEIKVGRFEQTVPEFFATEHGQLHLVFVDGNHHEESTLEYHRLAKEGLAPSGIIVHDDIAWSEGMIRAWSKIKNEESCEIEELLLGGVPSRGVLYLGSKKHEPIRRHHLDTSIERMARRLLQMKRR